MILVNAKGHPVGEMAKLAAHQQGLLHRAFSIFILRKNQSETEVLLQQRQFDKYHCGGLWTNTCCSHPQPGETTLAAAHRRLHEELNFRCELQEVGYFIYRAEFENGLIEHEYDHVFAGWLTQDTPIAPNPDEIANIRWLSLETLKNELALYPEKFTPWLVPALKQLQHITTTS